MCATCVAQSDCEAPAIVDAIQKPRYQTAAEDINRYITQHGLKTGDRLPTERVLSAQLGVGRTVVREAVKMLAATGIVRARQGSGLYVEQVQKPFAVAAIDLTVPLDAEHILGLLEFRLVLETQSAYLAAERATPRELQALDEATAFTGTSADSGEPSQFRAADALFHQAIAQAAHNPFLATTVESVGRLCTQAITLALSEIAGSMVSAAEQHLVILCAIREGRSDDAARAMRTHLEYTEETFRQAVRRLIAFREPQRGEVDARE